MGREAERFTPVERAAALKAQVREGIVNNQPGLIIEADLEAAACSYGLSVRVLKQMGGQDQHLEMTADCRRKILRVELAIPLAKIEEAARFLVGFVAASQISQAPEFIAAQEAMGNEAPRYLINKVKGFGWAINMAREGQEVDDLSLNFLGMQADALITSKHLDVPLSGVARAAAGR